MLKIIKNFEKLHKNRKIWERYNKNDIYSVFYCDPVRFSNIYNKYSAKSHYNNLLLKNKVI